MSTFIPEGESNPKLWGSRVVVKPVGPSDTMSYRCEGKCVSAFCGAVRMSVMRKDSEKRVGV